MGGFGKGDHEYRCNRNRLRQYREGRYASLGHSVVCLDIDAAKVAGLQDGQLPIYEPGLMLVRGCRWASRFTTDYDDALDGAERH